MSADENTTTGVKTDGINNVGIDDRTFDITNDNNYNSPSQQNQQDDDGGILKRYLMK